MDTSLVGKCGLYCGACSIYRGQRDDEYLRKKIANNANCEEELVRCNGCGALTTECWGYNCKIVVCLRSKDKNFCYECDSYHHGTCNKHNDLSKSYKEVGVDLRENLSKIQNGLTAEWLVESSQKFTCPHCGQALSAWVTTCHKCGFELEK